MRRTRISRTKRKGRIHRGHDHDILPAKIIECSAKAQDCLRPFQELKP